ncbi:MAG: DNA-binding response regulator [Desulfobacteraceae bacterium]|nr:MAG: DNA-binding response regulator [Desulfobacteraceae bacterium]
MTEKKKILIAEDHRLLREGLKALLNASEKFEIVAEAEDGLEAVRYVDKCKPDIVLLDLNMPRMNGLSALKEIKSRFKETKILALTVHESEEYILEALKLGANGYCLKNAGRNELLSAIDNILAGRSYLSPGVSEKVLQGYLEERKTVKSRSSWDTLTQREKDVLKMIGEDFKNKEIADFLCISVKTVEKHRSNLMRKLDLHSVSALTAFAIQKGLVTSER